MNVVLSADKAQMGAKAAEHAAHVIRQALTEQGRATVVVATGASQFTVLSNLIQQPNIDWQRVTGFHLDEYIGLPITPDTTVYLDRSAASRLTTHQGS